MKFSLLLGLLLSYSFAEYSVSRQSIESKYFYATGDSQNLTLMKQYVSLADEIFEDLSEEFDYEWPKRTSKIKLIFIESQDVANGYALAQKEFLAVYLPGGQIDFRGRPQWFRNVFAHELGHVITLKKLGFNYSYLGHQHIQTHTSEQVQGTGTLLIPNNNEDVWLVEGLAQLAAELAGYDEFDSRRRLLIEHAWKGGYLLSPSIMKTFTGDARENELVYNQGYAFIRFLHQQLGKQKFNAYLEEASSNNLIQALDQFHPEGFTYYWTTFKAHLTEQFGPGSEGEVLPIYVLETRKIQRGQTRVYASSQSNDFGRLDLYLEEEGQVKRIARRVEPDYHFSPDSNSIYFIEKQLELGLLVKDRLKKYHLPSQTITSLFEDSRIKAICSNSTQSYYLEWDRSRYQIKSFKHQLLKSFPLETQVNEIECDDQFMYVTLNNGKQSDIWQFDFNLKEFKPLFNSEFDETEISFIDQKLLFTSNQSGQYQIYQYSQGRLLVSPQVNDFYPTFIQGKLYKSHYSQPGFIHAMGDNKFLEAQLLQAQPDSLDSPTIPKGDLKLTKKDPDAMGLLGWNTLTGFSTLENSDDEVPILFSQNLIYGLGLYFGDPSFDHSLSIVTYLDKLVNPSNEIGSQTSQINVQAAYETAVLGPYLSLSGGMLKRTINADPREFDDIVEEDETIEALDELGLPISSLMYAQLGLILPLSFEWNLSYLYNLEKYGFGFSNINLTVDILTQSLNQISVNYSYVDPGRWTNKYAHTFNLSTGILDVKGVADTGTESDELIYQEERFKLLAFNWSIQKLWFDRISTQLRFSPTLLHNDQWQSQITQQLNLKSQLIQGYSALQMGSQYFTLRDLYLGFSTDLTYLDDNLTPQSNALTQLNRNRSLLPTRAALPKPSGFEDYIFQTLYLETRVVPWGNYVSSWQIGARVDLENPDSRNTQYFISLSL